MPLYNYICNNCSNLSEIEHPMDSIIEICSKCNSNGTMKKVPSNFQMLKFDNNNNDSKPGEVVKEYIDELKTTVSQDKELLKSRVWPNNK